MQFLLNPDGSVPPNTDLAALKRLGVELVMPSPMPQAYGMIAVERPAQLINNVLTQVWELQPALEPEPETEAPIMPDLSPAQFEFLLALSGYDLLWDGIEQQARQADIEAYAMLRGLRARSVFRWDETIRLIQEFSLYLPEGVSINPELLSQLWLRASTF